MGDEREVWPLIITPDDVVYRPVDTGAVLDSSIEFRIANAPHIVAYTEMERAAEQAALACEQPEPIELDGAGATLLLVRCSIVAATLAGLRPVRSVAWWQRAWTALGADVPLPPFRADPVWGELMHEASRLTLTASAQGEDDGPEAAAGVTVSDFRRLAPRLTAVALDEEFVSCWRASMPLTPTRFVETLLNGLDAARADVALYPGGGGSVDVMLGEGDAQALLELSWSDKAALHVDEVRIADALAHTGLFQRMMFNTERLAAMLGFAQVTILATGVGTYAFAAMGYPRDPELYQAMRYRRDQASVVRISPTREDG
ncbi:hypothetical protein J7F01_12705 [Streptomyces sp. ISL-22]|uniref:hypothetical protein n=1 Tax=unclassified Streptomyces TaxID=2593676 RepID=UPI001BEAE0F7|nr:MULTISPECIES: hypothetical protein [unclassified Streptomyces]MBT2420347.1 hypothetical protein [Streptomyces sp. ISL-24]MBT2433039.1 hypothetical protein [Streptomyces sp. ISL-22]